MKIDPTPRSSGSTDLSSGHRCWPAFRSRDEWGEDQVREILYDPYRVVYEIQDDRTEILVLSHYRQAFPEERI